ncbi:MAG: DUF2442 domain-containing protein [Thermoflexales bacterium]|nr:DUF2442 domain-containing protein [Thermoflexales bacterium]
MLQDIVSVRPLSSYRLYLVFEDGAEGEVDVSQLVSFTGVFAPLQDPAYFALVRVEPELGTICWPNQADLDPDVLYAAITSQELPDLDLALQSDLALV